MRRIGRDKFKTILLKIGVTLAFIDEREDVRVSVVVQNHIHLRGSGNLIVNFDAVKFLLGEIVPITVMLALFGRRVVKIIGLLTNLVQNMQQKTRTSARRIKHEIVFFNRQNVNDKIHDRARRKILPEFAAKKAAHKNLKRSAFAVQIGVGKIYFGEIADDGFEFLRIQPNIVAENFRVSGASFFVNLLNAFLQFFGQFFGKT